MKVIQLKQRYMRDGLPIRLGNLAANLARIGNTIPRRETWPFVNRNVVESKYFIEWTTAELPEQFWEPLVNMQIGLARLEREGKRCPLDIADRCAQAAKWSELVLEMMRLLEGPPDASREV